MANEKRLIGADALMEEIEFEYDLNGKSDVVSRVIEKLMEIKTEPGTDAHRTVTELMEWVKTL